MRNLLFLFLLMGSSVSMLSQNYFNERFNYVDNTSLDFSHDILIDSGYIVPGGYMNNNIYGIGIAKLDNYGTKSNVNVIQDDFYSFSLSPFHGGFKRFSSSSFFGVGLRREYTSWIKDYAILYKFNNTFDTIWTKIYGEKTLPEDTNYNFKQFDYTLDKKIISVGTIIKNGESSEVLLMKLDSSGNELWRKYFESGNLNTGLNVLSLPDGGYALSCHKWVFQSTVSHNYLIRTDSLGNELWRRYIGGDLDDGPLFLAWSDVDSTIVGAYHTADSAITNADSYNRLALIKVDVDNNLVYDNKYMPEKDYDQWNFYVYGLNLDDEGNIIVVGSTNEPVYHSEGYLFKISNDGDSLWYRQYRKGMDDQTDHYLTGVTATPDGGYSAVGYFVPVLSDTGNQDVWVIKVDSMGCIAQNDCWVGNKEILALLEKESLKIYPNPASSRIKILIPKENESEEYVLTIWDLYGRKAEEVIVPSEQAEVELDISNYASGLFNVIATKNGKIVGNGKFIKR